MTRIISVTSGKGGVGKTYLSLNLALYCVRMGLRVGLFLADLGSANAAKMPFNLSPQQTLGDVIAGRARMQDIVLHAHGIDIIPGSFGPSALSDLPSATLRRLDEGFRMLPDYDLMLVDTSSAGSSHDLALTTAAPEVLLVITPEPTALSDAYALVKHLQREDYTGSIQVVVNQAPSEDRAIHTYEKFRDVVRVYQGLDLPLLGGVPVESRIPGAEPMQPPLTFLEPQGHVALAVAGLATRLLRQSPVLEQDSLHAFWRRLCGLPPEPSITVAATQAGTPLSAQNAIPVDLDLRLKRLEAGLAAVMQHLQAKPGAASAATPHAKPVITTPSPAQGHANELPRGRRAGEGPMPGRVVRTAQRATPIDALQLRRVVGRMLVKAMPGTEVPQAQPVHIAVDQVQMDSANEYSLRPGRYTRISLHCNHIQSPDAFIEEIFANCDLSGCKVQHLGTHVRYWLTSDRDGCILLDGDDYDRNCVRVYMAAGGNSVQGFEVEDADWIPSLRRLPKEPRGAVAMSRILEKFPHEAAPWRNDEGELMALFQVSRRDREPLLCALHGPEEEPLSGNLRGQSP